MYKKLPITSYWTEMQYLSCRKLKDRNAMFISLLYVHILSISFYDEQLILLILASMMDNLCYSF
jgi:hypothetical protein